MEKAANFNEFGHNPNNFDSASNAKIKQYVNELMKRPPPKDGPLHSNVAFQNNYQETIPKETSDSSIYQSLHHSNNYQSSRPNTAISIDSHGKQKNLDSAKEKVKEFFTKYSSSTDPFKHEASETIMEIMKYYQMHIAKLNELIIKKEEDAKFYELCLFDSNQKLIGEMEQKKILQKQLQDYHTTENNYIEEIEALKKKMEQLKQPIIVKEPISPKYSEKIEKIKESQILIEQLERKNRVLTSEIEKLMNEIEFRDHEIIQLEKKNTESHYKLLEMESSLSRVKNEYLEAKVKIVQNQTLPQENELLKSEIESLRSMNAKLQESVERLINDVCETKYELMKASHANYPLANGNLIKNNNFVETNTPNIKVLDKMQEDLSHKMTPAKKITDSNFKEQQEKSENKKKLLKKFEDFDIQSLNAAPPSGMTKEQPIIKKSYDANLMPSDAIYEIDSVTAKSLQEELLKLNESKQQCEYQLMRLPGNPKKAKEKNLKESLENELETLSSKISGLRLKMKKLHII